MASSLSSTSEHRMYYSAQPLTRQKSSVLGAIKSLVTAPLGWFGGADTTNGKRRRQESVSTSPPSPEAATEVMADVDEAIRKQKRLRLGSPPKKTNTTKGAPGRPTIRRSSIVPRASSAVLPSSRIPSYRSTLSPLRQPRPSAIPVLRTMSIDPPQLFPHRNIPTPTPSFFNFGTDVDMLTADTGDVSMPPSSPTRLSPRPSFRMRSSMTPNPAQQHFLPRHISEPPPLNTLFSNPVFVRPPPLEKEEEAILVSTHTLGSLVESARTSRSPAKQQHAWLLFSEDEKDAPAERALHQLDVYKTPLIPTRLRNRADPDSIIAKVLPDMFRSRRSSKLVLMSDDRERSEKKTNKESVVNDTKPYAGEGGLKKLLARAKRDTEKEKEKSEVAISDKDAMTEGPPRSEQPSLPLPSLVLPAPSVSPAIPSDWFTSGASTPSSGGSSLRVGRQKTSRNHIQRPAARLSKSRFSAVYDEEGEGDDVMEGDDRVKEREMLEEAAKNVPIFKIPDGFSFAKDTPAPVPNSDDFEKAKEPPIKSLPFSFSKSSPSPLPTPSVVQAQSSTETVPAVPLFSTADAAQSQPNTSGKALSFNFESKHTTAPVQLPVSVLPASAPPAPKTTTVPNFFANSRVLKERIINAPSGLSSSNPSPAPMSTNSLGVPPNVKPADDRDESKSGSGVSFFPESVEKHRTEAAPTSTPAPSFFFGKPAEDKPLSIQTSSSFVKPTASVGDKSAIVLTSFSFGDHATDENVTPKTNSTLFGKRTEDKPSSSGDVGAPIASPFSFGDTSQTKKPETISSPKPMFGEPSAANTGAGTSAGGLFGLAAKPTSTGLFGEPQKSSPFSVAAATPPQSTPSPLSFSFGPGVNVGASVAPEVVDSAPVDVPKSAFTFGSSINSATPSTTSAPALPTTAGVSVPKPLFGGGTFSFRQEKEPEEAKLSSPFSFSPGTLTTTIAESKNPTTSIFTFGQTAPTSGVATVPASGTAAPPIAFSFSGGSAGTDVTNKPPFTFGVPSAQQHSEIQRPVTPPRSLDQEVRMEESPSRDMQLNGNDNGNMTAPFSFAAGSSGVNGSSSLFGGSQVTVSTSSTSSTTSPFTFGVPTPSVSNPFTQKKPEESRPFGGFGAPAINTSFSFGQQQRDETRPLSAGELFAFVQTPTSATNANTAFPFGAPTPVSTNPFAPVTAPSSPSTFNQPTPFTFGAPPVAPVASSSAFTFGSQPASPAGGPNLSLPQPSVSTTFGNGGGFGQTPSPSSPFTAPLPLVPSTSSGGTPLFTIGAAPAPSPAGQRQIKKLPRRGPVKR